MGSLIGEPGMKFIQNIFNYLIRRLVKNSWGTAYGENGFIKIRRGVNMCNIGLEYFYVKIA